MVVPAGNGATQDSAPGWSQYQGSASHAATLAEGPEPPFRVRWTLAAPAGDSLSAAVVAGEQAITSGDEALYGVDLASGEVLWEVPRTGVHSTPALASSGPDPLILYLDGPASQAETPSPSPTGTVSLTPDAGAGPSAVAASLVAVDPSTRREVWRAELAAGSRTGVTVAGDAAYVGDLQGNVTAVSVDDGRVRWTRDVGGRIDVPLTVSGDRVVAIARDVDAGDIAISATNADDGAATWPTQTFRLGSTASSAPAAVGGAFLIGLPDRLVHALAAEDGTERWTALTLSVFSPATSPAGSEDVYVADLAGGLYALDAADGSRRWTYQFNDLVIRGAPVRSGDHVLLGLQEGGLAAVDHATGHLVWQGAGTPGLVGALALSSDVVVAVMGGRDAGLIAFEHDPTGALVDLPSPTELDAGTTLPRIAAAAAIALALTLVPGILARRRFGSAFVRDEPEDAS